MLLKNVPGILPVLENSDLSQTKLWHRNIKNILPQQLTALILKAKYEEPESKIQLEIQFAVKYIKYAVEEGLVSDVKIADYEAPSSDTIAASNFIRGLHSMSFERRRAVLFALENDLPITQVEGMSLDYAMKLRRHVSKVSKEILDSNVLSIYSGFAFWENYQGEHKPLTNLEQSVYDAFGMNSYELSKRYANMVFDELFEVTT